MKKRYRKGIGKGAGKPLGRFAVEVAAYSGNTGNSIFEEVMNGGEQDEERRIDMTKNNQCNHTLEIAKEMYHAYAVGKDNYKKQIQLRYDDLPDDDKAGWLNTAEQALPIIGKHALGDVRDYLTGQAAGTSGWKKALYWAGGIIIAGILGGGAFLTLGGCGHNVDMTPERTEVCKDGSCLVVEPGHISYSQAQPETVVPPVVIKQDK